MCTHRHISAPGGAKKDPPGNWIKTYICVKEHIRSFVEGINMEIDVITDDHMHIDPLKGLGIEAAKRFKRAGGTCLFLVNKMSRDFGISVKSSNDFNVVFDRTISLKEKIIKETGLKVFAVIGVHPAEFVFLCNRFGTEEGLEISFRATEIASKKIEDGDATALGEMGRPHFEVEESTVKAANRLLMHGFKVAKELGCAIQLHTESSSEHLFKDLSKMAGEAGLPPGKVVKHFSGPQVEVAEKFGIMPSVLSSDENLRVAISESDRFLLESDYIDDKSRPGAVLGPKTVPRVTKKLLEEEVLSLDAAARIHKDNVERTYGVELG
jgi:TatD-related deoxyribonuclease